MKNDKISVAQIIERMTKMSDEEVKRINEYSSKELGLRLYHMRQYMEEF